MMIARDKAAAGSWWWVIKEQRHFKHPVVFVAAEKTFYNFRKILCNVPKNNKN
jgi:hypothetical protein